MLTGKNMDEKTHEKCLKGERSIYGDKKGILYFYGEKEGYYVTEIKQYFFIGL